MNMNRRNVLLGLGTAAAGSGAVFGSGAFTQVSADRSILIEVDDDSSSTVGIEAGNAPQGGFADLSADSNGAIEFNLGSETLNTDATVNVGDQSTLTGDGTDLDTSPSNNQVAFVIRDDSTFTDASNDALGVSFSIPDNSKINQIQFDFIGDSDNNALDTTATDNSGSGGTDFSSVSSVAKTGSSTANDLTAKFVLNQNTGTSDLADNHSGVAAGFITLDTTGASGSTSLDLTASITAEVVGMQSQA